MIIWIEIFDEFEANSIDLLSYLKTVILIEHGE